MIIGNSLHSQAQDKISAAKKANVQVYKCTQENGLKKDGHSRNHTTRSNYNKTYADDIMDVKIVVIYVGRKKQLALTGQSELKFSNAGSRQQEQPAPTPTPPSIRGFRPTPRRTRYPHVFQVWKGLPHRQQVFLSRKMFRW